MLCINMTLNDFVGFWWFFSLKCSSLNVQQISKLNHSCTCDACFKWQQLKNPVLICRIIRLHSPWGAALTLEDPEALREPQSLLEACVIFLSFKQSALLHCAGTIHSLIRLTLQIAGFSTPTFSRRSIFLFPSLNDTLCFIFDLNLLHVMSLNVTAENLLLCDVFSIIQRYNRIHRGPVGASKDKGKTKNVGGKSFTEKAEHFTQRPSSAVLRPAGDFSWLFFLFIASWLCGFPATLPTPDVAPKTRPALTVIICCKWSRTDQELLQQNHQREHYTWPLRVSTETEGY